MYCRNCGAVNPDGAEFCSVCGAALAPKTPEAKSNTLKKFNLSKNKLIAIIASAVTVIALIVVIAVAAKSAKPPYVKAALQAVDDLLSLNAERTVKIYCPEPFIDYFEDEEDIDIDEMIENIDRGLKETIEDYDDEYDIDLKKLCKAVKVKVTGTKEIKKKKIRNMNEFIEDEMDIDDVEISGAWFVELEVSMKWNDSRLNKKFDKNETCEVLVVEIDGKWYGGGSIWDTIAYNAAGQKKQSFGEALSILTNKLEEKLD